ncbi:hypothetical protein C8F04DRAFT_899482, partial [Mycena alexandri]
DPAGERIRAAERVSPKNLDQQRRQPLRESPKSRAREISPTTASLPPPIMLITPEGGSPAYHTPLQSPGDHEYSYNPYQNPYQNQDHGSPTQVSLTRRMSNSGPVLFSRGSTPPLQAMGPRTPDRSLPVQEEQEHEV